MLFSCTIIISVILNKSRCFYTFLIVICIFQTIKVKFQVAGAGFQEARKRQHAQLQALKMEVGKMEVRFNKLLFAQICQV